MKNITSEKRDVTQRPVDPPDQERRPHGVPTPRADHAEILRGLGSLILPNALVELRVLGADRAGTVSGYFDPNHRQSLANACAEWSGRGAGVYLSLNPVNADLLARGSNRVKTWAKHTTSDADILRRVRLPIDFDPRRPSGISSTNQEHEAALARAHQCRDWLRDLGWPDPLLGDSGNGSNLVFAVDLPNDPAATELLSRCLQAIAFQFDDDVVAVDLTTYNAARIWRAPGTLNAKGDSTEERPHRLAGLLEVPTTLATVSCEQLETLAAMLPSEEQADSRQHVRRTKTDFDLERWIEDHGLPVVAKKTWQGGRIWLLNPCPWNAEHNNRAAYVGQLANGAIAAGCHHNGCRGKGWPDLRALYEPEASDRTSSKARRSSGGHTNGDTSEESLCQDRWPDPPDPAAFYGLAGDIVRVIEPHSEADPVALLIQLLVGFGNLVGRIPHFTVEADDHYLNLFANLVGSTSKGRKGVSWGQILRLLHAVDPDWADNRVMTGLSSGEGLIWQVRDAIKSRQPVKQKGQPPRYEEVEVDPGVPDKRLLVQEPEFARVLRVLGRDGNTLSGTVRQAWDTGTLRTLTKNSPAKATGAHVSIIGHITRDELRRYLTETEAGNGFANRFLWLCVRRSKCLPEGGQIQSLNFTGLLACLNRAVDFGRKTGELRRDNSARAMWAGVYPDLSDGKPGLLGAVISRAEAQVMRLACVYALLDSSAVVRPEHLEAALALWAFCERSAQYIFGDRLGDPDADSLLQALRHAPQGLTRTKIRDLFGRHRSGADINRCLGVLLEAGLVRCEQEQADGPGRPSERWVAVTHGANAI